MAVSIKDLVKNLSREEVLEDILAVAKALGLTTTSWNPNGKAWAVVSILAGKISDYWNAYLVPAIRANFLDYAEGDWLTFAAWATYFTVRKEATFAGGTLVIENRGTDFFNFVPGDLRVKIKDGATNKGKTFTSVTGGTLSPWAGGLAAYPTVEIQFKADEAGSGSNAAPGDVDENLVVGAADVYARTNTTSFYGTDEESDEDLRARARLQTGTLSVGGVRAVYEYVAKSTKRPDGTFVDVSRVRLLPSNGNVYVYLASPTGAATGDTSIEGSDVYLVNIEIQNKVAPVGINVNVSAAIEIPVAYTIHLYVKREANLTAEDAIAAAQAALDEHFANLRIGGDVLTPGGQGYVIASELGAIASESAKGIFRATVEPNLDTPLDPNEVAVPSLTINATVVTKS